MKYSENFAINVYRGSLNLVYLNKKNIEIIAGQQNNNKGSQNINEIIKIVHIINTVLNIINNPINSYFFNLKN